MWPTFFMQLIHLFKKGIKVLVFLAFWQRQALSSSPLGSIVNISLWSTLCVFFTLRLHFAVKKCIRVKVGCFFLFFNFYFPVHSFSCLTTIHSVPIFCCSRWGRGPKHTFTLGPYVAKSSFSQKIYLDGQVSWYLPYLLLALSPTNHLWGLKGCYKLIHGNTMTEYIHQVPKIDIAIWPYSEMRMTTLHTTMTV